MIINVRPEDHYHVFWQIARMALAEKLITQPQLDLISRAGTRKAPYWGRHIHDLVGFLILKELPDDLKQYIINTGIEIESERHAQLLD